MSKNSKLVARLRSRPKDFTWEELTSLLKHFAYHEKAGSGSSRKFINSITDHKLAFHKPHPENVVKRYVIDEVIATLIENGLIPEEEDQQ
ncbi:type II toxin-antitoxin system HicA family toxin [Nitrosospira briensis]|uniref:type II toxin-antitoxin system HicA family toxin n=1 Tax=Nitrosospira briensis TaxID=35799 RepID=UPI000468353A|nr:type II toxin-antitoxin system HicA family toxin [Nitrosospira briensis]